MEKTSFFDNTKTEITYDSLGRIASETNDLGQTTRYEYDAFGRVNAIINPLNQRTSYKYDNRGNLVEVTDALGQITRYEYYEYGRQTATVFANGDRVEMGYDNFNRQTTAKDENGNLTQYSYDNFNRVTAIELANNARTNYRYDNLGQLIEIEDANRHATGFEYDDFGRMVATILPQGQQDLNVFDNLGFLSSYTDFNGDTINYNYDGFGRLKEKTFSNPDIANVAYNYDPVTSQIIAIADGRGTTNYEYDLRDRLSEITMPDGKTIAYGYDVLNNVTSLTTDSGTTSYSYDALNRLDLVKDGSEVLADYDYNAIGNLIQTNRADGTVETRTYDARSRLTNIETLNSVGQEISSFSYTLDGVGNRTQVVENGRTVDYVYDSVNRLISEKISDENRAINYTYDLVGNRLSRNDSVGGLTTYNYDANDRLTQMLSAGVTTQFTYDDNGSMLSRSNTTETISYDWINDGENRLVGVQSTRNSQNIEYVYNAEGNRVASIVDGVQTNYLVTPGSLSKVLAEYDSNGQVATDYTYGLGLVRSTQAGSDSFYHTDGLGSVRMLTDTTGLVSDTYTYDAYGMSLSNSDGSYQFAGERRDAETGLDYLRARYYDPELGRFISKDAFAGFLNDPMSMHDYQYAHANPVNNTDPTGYFTLTEAVTAISFGGILAGVGSSLAYVGHQYVTGGGISAEEGLVMFDQWVAGYAHGVSGGITTAIRREDYGEIQAGDHAFLWNMGNLAGVSSSFILGFQLPGMLAANMGTAKWATNFATGLAGISEAYGVYEAGRGLADGQWEYSDVFNLLSLAPYAVPAVATVKNSLGTIRAANRATGGIADDAARATGSIDDVLRSSQQMETTVGGGGSEYVYRGDGRSPQEIKEAGGFWPWNPDRQVTLEEHVYDLVDPKESQWVSTSTDSQSAAGFAGEGGYVHKIRKPPGGVDVQESLNIPPGPYNEKEIAYEGGVGVEFIEGG